MDNLEFLNADQVSDQYEKLIDEYNEVLIKAEELEEIDDNLQALRAVNLDRYDYMIMLDVYNCFNSYDDKETVEELTSLIEECEEEIDEYRSKLSGLNLKDHLYNYYNMEQKKEQYEIQIKCCEKYLEKAKKTKDIEKKKEKIRPASPRRNLTESSLRPMSPRLTGGSYTPSKRKQEDSLTPKIPPPKLEPLVTLKTVSSPLPPPPIVPPIYNKSSSESSEESSSSSQEISHSEEETNTQVYLPPPLPLPPAPKKRNVKPKIEVAVPLPISLPEETEIVPKKRIYNRKKKTDE
jgi:tetratricopeptide (TPR) repeat protein